MKTYILLTYVTLLTLAACGQTNGGYEWKAKIKVINDDGIPIPGAHVQIGYYTNSVSTVTDGIADTNGIFMFDHTAQSEYVIVSFEAKKEEYYSINQEVDLAPPYSSEKWNITKTMTLKKVGRPVAMYAKRISQLKFPEFNKAIGYDLMIGDWVGTYGKGVNADLLLTQHHTSPQSGYPITMSFPNIGDGIQEFTLRESDKGSGLRSDHEAPNAGYQPVASQIQTTNPNRNFYFRVRTMLDENGKVVSARYGKIYGDLAQFTYYFNPTINDQNVEFDPKQNLIQGLQSFEQVSAP